MSFRVLQNNSNGSPSRAWKETTRYSMLFLLLVCTVKWGATASLSQTHLKTAKFPEGRHICHIPKINVTSECNCISKFYANGSYMVPFGLQGKGSGPVQCMQPSRHLSGDKGWAELAATPATAFCTASATTAPYSTSL
eukprot:1161332-Pelagomonas_calceolata.AAC.17